MRRTKLYVSVALLAGVMAPRAHAQLADTLSIKPVLMLMVDTSGSMEHLPDTSTQTDVDPQCTNDPSSDQRNRWAITLEALTGTFQNYKCTKKIRATTYPTEFDRDYFLPHYDFATGAVQASDGVLDSYQDRIKFGLMTFDGVLTTVDGATLVAHSTYAGVKAQVNGIEGMYSYPDLEAAVSSAMYDTPQNAFGWKPLSFPGCTSVYGINAGARGKGTTPGSLISVGPASTDTAAVKAQSESGAYIRSRNEQIQSDLLKVRPYGGTPIAGMLDDLRYYMKNDYAVAKGSDAFYHCRKRYAILLTDGAPDRLFRNDPRFQCESNNDAACAGGICQCPYDTEENLALKLRTEDGLEKLWVVAFNVEDGTALTALDDIAQAGGLTDSFRALTPEALRTQLDTLMGFAQPDATSRSVPVVVNTGRSVMLSGKQFQITAGFRVGDTEDEPWQGYLYRSRVACNGTVPEMKALQAAQGDLFHATLNLRNGSEREIKSVMPSVSASNGSLFVHTSAETTATIAAAQINMIKPDGSTFGSDFTETDVSAQSISQSLGEYDLDLQQFGKNAATLPAYFGTDEDGRDQISDYLHGISDNRKGRKLGDIYHSNPTVLPPVAPGSEDLNAFDPQLRSYFSHLLASTGSPVAGHYDTAIGRPGVVFVGTNDGLLHAFNLDTWTNKDGDSFGPGHEFWNFVPPALFGKLKSTAAPTHQFMFDGTPVIKDMLVEGTTMKTILIAAVRGVPAFIALDVTYPEEPKFLWQRSFAELGNTVGTPALAQVKVKFGTSGLVQQRAVAILPGGQGSLQSGSCAVDKYSRGKATNSRAQVRCWALRGRSLYVVDVETGALIQQFDGRHFGSPVTGSAVVDGTQLTLTQAAYMTDEDGILWRLSMLNTDPAKWRVSPIWDLYGDIATNFAGTPMPAASYAAGHGATYPPLLTRNPITGNVTLVVGTGDVDNLADVTPHRVVSLEEKRTKDAYGELAPGGITANWKLQLEAAEGVTGPLVMLNDVVYFTSFQGPSGDVCMGTSRIVGGHVRNTLNGLPVGYLTPEGGGATKVLQYHPSGAPDSLLLGLSISRDPICVAGTAENDPLSSSPNRFTQTGATGGGSFQIRSMVAGKGGTVMDGSTAGGATQRQFSTSLPNQNISRSVGWASSIE